MDFFLKKTIKLKEDFEILSDLDCCIIFFISPRKFNKSVEKIKTLFLWIEKF